MIQHIHIPKTGGSALAQAYATSGAINRNGHAFTLSWLKPGDDAVTIVRDPVARFVSSFNFIAARRSEESPVPWPWTEPEELARELGTDLAREVLPRIEVFTPQGHWLDGDLSRLIWVGHTETLYADFVELKAMLGLDALPLPGPAANTGPPHQPLTQQAIDAIHAHYADDYALIERLP